MSTMRDYHGRMASVEALKKAAMEALREAVRRCGGPTGLAKRMRLNQSTVSMWLFRESTPPERCADIEAATGVRREELRPDIFGPTPKAKAKPRRKAA
jgi:DNA-binding transcriptional regulator YdaS (Cro superfamily)